MHAVFSIDEAEYRVFAARDGEAYRVHVDDRSYRVAGRGDGSCTIDGVTHEMLIAVDGDTVHIWMDGETQTLRYHDPVAYYGSHADGSAGDIIVAPMPGTVIAVNAMQGQPVARGDTLLVIESMKLETAVKAPRDGVIAVLHVAVGQSFDRSAPLATLAAAEA